MDPTFIEESEENEAMEQQFVEAQTVENQRRDVEYQRRDYTFKST
jgi:hypothetical protein